MLRIRQSIIAVTGILLLSACSSATSSTVTGDPVATEAGDATAESAPPSDNGDGGSSGEVVFGFASDGGQLYDPHSTASIAVGSYLAPVFDTLVSVADDGSIQPALAESWELSEDGSTLTLELRDDVTFHDGTPFDAAAVVANIERGKTLATSAVASQLEGIIEATADGDHTVVLNLEGPTGAILPLLGGQAGMMISPEAFENEDLATRPIGTGPFQVSDESVPGSQMVYTAYSDYWDPSVQGIERFVIQIVAPPAQTAGIVDGSVDVILMTSNPQDAPQIESADKSVSSTGLEYVYTLFLSKEGVFADAGIRTALSQAIDRQAIADSVLLGQCEVTAQPFNPSSWAAPSDLAPPPVDVEAAAATIDDAGVGGTPVRIVVSGAGTLLPSVAEAIQAMAEGTGLDVSVEPLPPAQLLQTYLEGGADAYFSTQTGGADPSVVISRLTSSLSPGGGVSDAMTDLAAEGARATDQSGRASAYQDWARAYQEEAFHISICQQDVKAAHAPEVTVPNFIDPLTVDPRGITVDG